MRVGAFRDNVIPVGHAQTPIKQERNKSRRVSTASRSQFRTNSLSKLQQTRLLGGSPVQRSTV